MDENIDWDNTEPIEEDTDAAYQRQRDIALEDEFVFMKEPQTKLYVVWSNGKPRIVKVHTKL